MIWNINDAFDVCIFKIALFNFLLLIFPQQDALPPLPTTNTA